MTLSKFISTYQGVKVDYDGFAGAQCVDLFRQHAKDVDGIKERLEPCSSSGGAKDLFLDYDKMPLLKKYYTKVRKACLGDIAVWGATKSNPYGHVAIILADMGNAFIVFEQDGYKQDGAKLNVRSTDGLLGILRSRA